MMERNILPYDGEAILIDEVETARIFGREMPIPRMTAWFGDGAYSYSGILHLPAPFPAIIERLRERAAAPRTLSAIGQRHKLYQQDGWNIYTPGTLPRRLSKGI